MTPDTPSRRAVLGAGLGALVGLVASGLGRAQPVNAADGDPVVAGQSTQATRATELASLSADPSFAGRSESGVGLEGSSRTSRGVRGTSDAGTGVEGRSNTSPGVYGYSNKGAGVHAYSGSSDGVSGYTAGQAAAGVRGQAINGVSFGVIGEHLTAMTEGALGGYSAGVVGLASNSADVAGVAAVGQGGAYALSVNGSAKFTRSGRTLVPAGRSYVDVTVPGGLRSSSLVLATLMLNRTGVFVQSAVPNAATGKVRIYLNRVASSSSSTPVAWFVLN